MLLHTSPCGYCSMMCRRNNFFTESMLGERINPNPFSCSVSDSENESNSVSEQGCHSDEIKSSPISARREEGMFIFIPITLKFASGRNSCSMVILVFSFVSVTDVSVVVDFGVRLEFLDNFLFWRFSVGALI